MDLKINKMNEWMNEEKKHFLKSFTNWTVINIFLVNFATFSLLPIRFTSVRLLLMISAPHNQRLYNSLLSFCSVDFDYIFFLLFSFFFSFSMLEYIFPAFRMIWSFVPLLSIFRHKIACVISTMIGQSLRLSKLFI